MSKTTTLHVHHAFCIFLCPFLHDYDVKIPNFTFYGLRKQATTKLYFFFLTLDMVPSNSNPGGFAYIWQRKWVGIIAIKTERTQIHFLSDVLIAVALLDIKVPNGQLTQQDGRGKKTANLLWQAWQSFCLIKLSSKLHLPLNRSFCKTPDLSEDHEKTGK